MIGINEIIQKIIKKEPLTENERFKIINSKQVKPEVLEYLSTKLSNLTIEIGTDYNGNVLDLMKKGILEGWCWQTTESSIVFFNDDDYIERGNLKFTQYKKYYHSWICFKKGKEEYVFDPCLDILCKKKLYSKIFEVVVMGKVTAKQVRDDMIYHIANKKPRETSWLDKFLDEDTVNRKKQETQISGNDDVTSPMYRNNTGYIADIQNNKVKRLVAHYYFNA